MLTEIYCDKFNQSTIHFNKGLNVIQGTNIANNSIGKSTFLLIVDFAFGGKTYATNDDILKNLGNHTICFSFSFNGSQYHFKRSIADSNYVHVCDSNYEANERISLKEYNDWLSKMYAIETDSFRNAVSRYIRVYGKDNCNEKKPLNGFAKEKDETAILSLLKLLDSYNELSLIENRFNKCKEEKKALDVAQKNNLIPKISRTTYRDNVSKIAELEFQRDGIVKEANANLIDVDTVVSKEVLSLRSQLNRLKKEYYILIEKRDLLKNERNYKFGVGKIDLEELNTYFPGVDIKRIEEINSFHNKISKVLKQEFKTSIKMLENDISRYKSKIEFIENSINELVDDNTNVQTYLNDYADTINLIDKLKNENHYYEMKLQLEETFKTEKENLKIERDRKNALVSNKINNQMRILTDRIYSEDYEAPVLAITNNSYSFYNPNDTGTGSAFRSLIVFDLAVLELSNLPILVHDSLLLKNIADEVIHNIIKEYQKTHKQVFISIDKVNSYDEETEKILNDNCVLRLGNNGKELFGWSWAKQIEKGT